ncbi:putative fimbrial adhesin [Escherichia coli]|uniref:Putative fimbrial adhesin n=1 Tax=Escherichia coli TaxID=562 RepID=A0A3S4MG83_ECOLX|nr:putative fimbrial adhesin [Escherichia coli]
MLKIWDGIAPFVILVHQVIILLLRHFLIIFGTVIVSDVNNNSPGTVLPSQDWKIGHYRLIVILWMIMRFIFLVFLGLIRQERLVIIRGAIYLFL